MSAPASSHSPQHLPDHPTAPPPVDTPHTPDAGLLRLLSTPRPAGSAAERRVVEHLAAWLDQRGIPYTLQPFTLYPHFWVGVGGWLAASSTLLAWTVRSGRGWAAPGAALAAVMVGLGDVAFNLPLASRFGRTRGLNLLVQFGPSQPVREVILCAHYDSKTEWMDHRPRTLLVRGLPLGIALSAVLGVIGPLERRLAVSNPPRASALRRAAQVLSLALVIPSWLLGLNLALGRLRPRPSRGAVDNGAACAVLMHLAEQLARNPARVGDTRLTLALFGGEEVNMQGSRAFVRSLPAGGPPRLALNLEVLAQDGEYVVWEQDGIALRLWPASPRVLDAISRAVRLETGTVPRRVGPINSDGGSFLRRGIPAATLGTYDRRLRDRGFHLPSDNPERVVPERILEAVRILMRFIDG